MTERAAQYTWVDIHTIVLAPGERAPHIPADTRQLPLEMQVKGFLLHEARVGEAVAIMTPAGRTLHGTLRTINPPYTHTYGPPLPALSPIGSEVRAILRARGQVQ